MAEYPDCTGSMVSSQNDDEEAFIIIYSDFSLSSLAHGITVQDVPVIPTFV